MIAYALYLFKATLCSGLLYGYYHVVLRNRVFHQYNRFYLLGSMAAALVFPLLTLPSFITEPAQGSPENWRLLFAAGNHPVRPEAGSLLNWETIQLAGYFLISVLLFLPVLSGAWNISKLMRTEKAMLFKGVQVYFTNHPMAPFSYFSHLFWRKDLDLHTSEGAAIFRHELAHIKAGHSMDKLLLQLVLAFCWINPFFWIIRRELQIIHEFVADQDAARNSDAAVLARMILRTVYGNQYPTLINPFFQQPIKRRIAMLHKTLQKPRYAYFGRLLALPVAALILLLVAEKQAAAADNDPLVQQAQSKIVVADTLPTRDTNIKEMHVDATNDSVHRITITYKDGRQVTYNEQVTDYKRQGPNVKKNDQTLVVIDGTIVGTMAEIGDLDKRLKASEIATVHVWKGDEGEKRYGAKGKAGVIEITTLANSKEVHMDASQTPNSSAKTQVRPVQIKPKDDASQALLVIDGKEMGRMSDYAEGKFPVKQDLIESMNVLKDKTAIEKYGDKGKYGVIELTMKKQ